MRRIILAAITVIFFIPANCFSNDIDLIKNASFSGYKATTIGKMLEYSFSNCIWSVSKTPIGETVVRFEGLIPQKLHNERKAKLREVLTQRSKSIENPAAISLYEGNAILNGVAQRIEIISNKKITQFDFVQQKSKALGDCEKIANSEILISGYEATKKYVADFNSRPDYLQSDRAIAVKAEKDLNEFESMTQEAWDAKVMECTGKFNTSFNKVIDALYWTVDSKVIIEWKVFENRTGFTLHRFGGEGLPSFSFGAFLKSLAGEDDLKTLLPR